MKKRWLRLWLSAALLAFHIKNASGQTSFEVRYTFPSGPPGAWHPATRLLEGTGGDFYGTTAFGGTYDLGTVFRFNVLFNSTTVLCAFNGTNGRSPWGGIVKGDDGNFYGVTRSGGSNQYGTAFKMTAAGALTLLWSFNGANGSSPNGPLEKGPSGGFFGTTAGGGSFGLGTIFKLTTNGVTTLHSFDGTNGGNPSVGLVFGDDGHLYGQTRFGGSNFAGPNTGYGTIFRVTTNGTYTRLLAFDGVNGRSPLGGLATGRDGFLYGVSDNGGTWGFGTIFKVTTNGTLTTLVNFDGTNGIGPMGRLVQAKNNNFYGVTAWRDGYAATNYGTIFRMSPRGELKTLVTLNGTNGMSPFADFIAASDGYLYGTLPDIQQRRLINGGTLVRLAEPPTLLFVSSQSNKTILTWSSLANRQYLIEYKTSLSAPFWQGVGNRIAAGDTTSFTNDIVNDPQRVYRVGLFPFP